MKEYDHKKIEKKWQKEWETDGLYKVEDDVAGKENFYQLVEFTYPSGNLHVGHWYAFAVPDIFARYKRMRGWNVLYPMGFDAFGLPAENAAIKEGADPKKWTYDQMDKMRGQFRSMGAVFDWEREVVSCDPSYYRWTQWMFTQFLKNDLAYRAVTKVNWCPKDQTILANEQVVDGCCERCGTEIMQKDQEQWMLRITKYADRLVDDLEKLNWPNSIKESQKNWIGRSEGSEISFKLSTGAEVKVFTTRADTLFGVTYIVLAPEHALISNLKSQISNWNEVEQYISDTQKKSELDRQQSKEKTGVELKGVTAINPANGEAVPVWIADYVLAGYGTGAVMAVPAHDERDFEFAKKYGLPMRRVVELIYDSKDSPIKSELPIIKRDAICAIVRNPKDDTYMCSVWKNGIHMHGLVTGGIDAGENVIETAKREIYEETGYKNLKLVRGPDFAIHSKFFHRMKKENRWARFQYVFFDLVDDEHDPISEREAAIHDIVWKTKSEMKDFFSVIEGQFLNTLVANPEYIFTDDGITYNSGEFSELPSEEARQKITEAVGGKMVKTYRLRDWGISRQRYWGVPIPIVYDPEGKAHPIPDEHLPWLLPTDVDHTPDGTAPLARSKELLARTEKIFGKGWKPEVETMDTFVDSSWYFYRYLDNKNEDEFASRLRRDAWMPVDLYMGGPEHTTMHLLYSRFWVKALRDLGLVEEDEAYLIRRNRGLVLGPDGNKMSKSKGNVVNPDEIVERLGADTVRMYLAFMGPYGVTGNYPWDPNGVVGVRRFLERVWRLQSKVNGQMSNVASQTLLHKTIQKVSEDIELFKFNTCISAMMICLNEWEADSEKGIAREDFKKFLQILAPFAPHITDELWSNVNGHMSNVPSIHLSSWPLYDESKITEDEITIAIQINGKVRGTVVIPADIEKEGAEAYILAQESTKKIINGRKIERVIYVPMRILSVIVAE